jgi:hypothetical protein
MTETTSNVMCFSSAEGIWNRYPELVTRLHELHTDGKSNSQIARLLEREFSHHFSRAAISGKLSREGLRRESTVAQRLSRVSSTHIKTRVKEIKSERAPPIDPAFGAEECLADIEIETSASRVPLLAARKNHCRWPAADDSSAREVCGAPVFTGSYCRRHHDRSLQSRPVITGMDARTV